MAERYVIDASVLGHYLAADTYTAAVEVLLTRLDQDTQLHIPEFCLIECVNILWKAAHENVLPLTDAESLAESLLSLPFQVEPVETLLLQALQIGLTHQLAIYDSLYVALALNLNGALITVDQHQAQAAIAAGAKLKAITDFSP